MFFRKILLMKVKEGWISKKLDHFFSTLISRLLMDGFEFRFHKNLLKGCGSVSRGLSMYLGTSGVLTKNLKKLF